MTQRIFAANNSFVQLAIPFFILAGVLMNNGGIAGRLVDLAKVPSRCVRIVFPVSIYDSERTGQAFGQVRDAYIRVVDEATADEIIRYDLTEDFSKYSATIFGELFRQGLDWHFRAVGDGYTQGLRGIAIGYGVNVTS